MHLNERVVTLCTGLFLAVSVGVVIERGQFLMGVSETTPADFPAVAPVDLDVVDTEPQTSMTSDFGNFGISDLDGSNVHLGLSDSPAAQPNLAAQTIAISADSEKFVSPADAPGESTGVEVMSVIEDR